MVGRADSEGVEALAHLVKHLAEVEILLGFRPALGRKTQVLFVDVADCHHVAQAAGVLGIAGAFAADTHASELNFFIRRPAFPRGNAAPCPITGADSRRSLQEPATICSTTHVNTP